MSTVAAQLESIHSMLAAGHRSIRLPRHSLLLWGITGAILCLGTEHVITLERFPGHLERAVALLLFLGIVLSGLPSPTTALRHNASRRARNRCRSCRGSWPRSGGCSSAWGCCSPLPPLSSAAVR